VNGSPEARSTTSAVFLAERSFLAVGAALRTLLQQCLAGRGVQPLGRVFLAELSFLGAGAAVRTLLQRRFAEPGVQRD
jgi:hypothetical protein